MRNFQFSVRAFKTFFILLIITAPAFIGLFQSGYFEMHDDQHIARLYLLDQGIRQGDLYPRWVDTMGFNFGYPLFNFYPPFIYYLAEFFHLIGFSLIWSVKMVIIAGFIFAALGTYLLTKALTKNSYAGYLSSSLYTYFTYHAVVVYVRGAVAEFFTMAILPFLFLAIFRLAKKPEIRSSLLLGVMFATLILSHPLIAFPSLFFILGYVAFCFLQKNTDKKQFVGYGLIGGAMGLMLSAFFWIPSMLERKFTLVDTILTRELAAYDIHFVHPSQFLYSPWGYGGSAEGLADGLTFQLGRVHIYILVGAIILSYFYAWTKGRRREILKTFGLFVGFLGFSLFMATEYSKYIWDSIEQLAYLQFPWRFLTFAALFIAVSGGFSITFLHGLSSKSQKKFLLIFSIGLILLPVLAYSKYFQPRALPTVGDKQKTSFHEIAWRVSRSTHEFSPKGVATTKSQFNTTVIDITEDKIKENPFEIVFGEAEVKEIKNKFARKDFEINSLTKSRLRFNTFNFPGWTAYLDGQEVPISDTNRFNLITVDIPEGKHSLELRFETTPARRVGNILSLVAFVGMPLLLFNPRLKI